MNAKLPEENQHANRNDDFLPASKSHKIRRAQHHQIKNKMLFHCFAMYRTRRLPLGDQLRQPSVVYVARQIPCSMRGCHTTARESASKS